MNGKRGRKSLGLKGQIVFIFVLFLLVSTGYGFYTGYTFTRSAERLAPLLASRSTVLRSNYDEIYLVYGPTHQGAFVNFNVDTGQITSTKKLPKEWKPLRSDKIQFTIPKNLVFAIVGSSTITITASSLLKPAEIYKNYRSNPVTWWRQFRGNSSRVVAAITGALSGFDGGVKLGEWFGQSVNPPSTSAVEANLASPAYWHEMSRPIFEGGANKLPEMRWRVLKNLIAGREKQCDFNEIDQISDCSQMKSAERRALCPDLTGTVYVRGYPSASDFRRVVIAGEMKEYSTFALKQVESLSCISD